MGRDGPGRPEINVIPGAWRVEPRTERVDVRAIGGLVKLPIWLSRAPRVRPSVPGPVGPAPLALALPVGEADPALLRTERERDLVLGGGVDGGEVHPAGEAGGLISSQLVVN